MKAFKPHTLNLKFIYFSYTNGSLWFRWFGKGSGWAIKNTTKHSLLFSERNGYTKGYRIGKWWIKKLNRV